MFGNNFFNSNGAFPVFYNITDNDKSETKLEHDSYEVYVNQDFVGRKELITQSEKPGDVEDHLKAQGFRNFNTQVLGDHILINAADREEGDIKNNLNIYLNIR
ncbi:hypothetical protein HMPREF1982_02169 [Clostridiales bacterium oral taxon 876 str. F0540]|nr:hypothetical protein HMPREF1982_02169 [Clostridiales bacterium oral taxon 876 str. F0540]